MYVYTNTIDHLSASQRKRGRRKGFLRNKYCVYIAPNKNCCERTCSHV